MSSMRDKSRSQAAIESLDDKIARIRLENEAMEKRRMRIIKEEAMLHKPRQMRDVRNVSPDFVEELQLNHEPEIRVRFDIPNPGFYGKIHVEEYSSDGEDNFYEEEESITKMQNRPISRNVRSEWDDRDEAYHSRRSWGNESRNFASNEFGNVSANSRNISSNQFATISTNESRNIMKNYINDSKKSYQLNVKDFRQLTLPNCNVNKTSRMQEVEEGKWEACSDFPFEHIPNEDDCEEEFNSQPKTVFKTINESVPKFLENFKPRLKELRTLKAPKLKRLHLTNGLKLRTWARVQDKPTCLLRRLVLGLHYEETNETECVRCFPPTKIYGIKSRRIKLAGKMNGKITVHYSDRPTVISENVAGFEELLRNYKLLDDYKNHQDQCD